LAFKEEEEKKEVYQCDKLLDPEVLSWKLGDQILAWALESRDIGNDDFILNRAIGKKKKRRKKLGIVENENLVEELNLLKNMNSILKVIKTMKTEQINRLNKFGLKVA
jgi:hypothetical protein